jgi:hypothetical protein
MTRVGYQLRDFVRSHPRRSSHSTGRRLQKGNGYLIVRFNHAILTHNQIAILQDGTFEVLPNDLLNVTPILFSYWQKTNPSPQASWMSVKIRRHACLSARKSI